MAPATTSPIKILTDLGYEVWKMNSDADILKALVRAVNSLDPKDGRIPILQDAIREIRGASRSAAPSKAQKITEKKTTIKGSKFLGTAKPAATSRVNPVALLPAASEDQSIFSTLVKAFTNIGSLLKRIGGILRIQFLFKKLLAARQRRKDALDEKRKREGELESNSGGLGKRITKTLTKPIKSFWSTLLGFFKNIIFASALIGFLKWMKDPENLKKIVDISTWFYKHGKTIIATLVGLLALNLGFKILGIFVGLNRLLKLFRLGSLLKRIPWWKTAQAASGQTGRKLLTSEKPMAKMGTEMMTSMGMGKFLPMSSGIVSESANIASQIAGKSSTTLAPKVIDEGIERVMFEGGDDIAARVSNFMVKTTQNITQVFDPERLTKGLLNLNTADTDKLVEQAIAEGGESAAQKKMNKLLTQGVTDTVAKSPTAFFSKGATEVLPEVGGMPGSDIMKLIGDKQALKKLLKNKFR